MLAKLSYPEPGVTQLTDCLLITDCLKIRVIDTSTHETLAFTLTLYPQFGDPVSADFSIFINQCTASTIAVTNPPDLVIARSASPSNAVQKSVLIRFMGAKYFINLLCQRYLATKKTRLSSSIVSFSSSNLVS